ncbi:MAG: NADH-quinone oxidoreductase subunit J [Chthoniobacterales bacterium]
MASTILFWIFAAYMLAFGAGVVVCRNPVSSAMCLVMSFIALAALFVTLNAYFIGVIQVLVYAGAVMVLFLFIIMLLDLRTEVRRAWNLTALVGGAAVVFGFVGLLLRVLKSSPLYHVGKAEIWNTHLDDVREIGFTLFSKFNLPFQVVGILLLVSTIGVVILSRKELK